MSVTSGLARAVSRTSVWLPRTSPDVHELATQNLRLFRGKRRVCREFEETQRNNPNPVQSGLSRKITFVTILNGAQRGHAARPSYGESSSGENTTFHLKPGRLDGGTSSINTSPDISSGHSPAFPRFFIFSKRLASPDGPWRSGFFGGAGSKRRKNKKRGEAGFHWPHWEGRNNGEAGIGLATGVLKNNSRSLTATICRTTEAVGALTQDRAAMGPFTRRASGIKCWQNK
ncbi:hypothetical protein KM043_001959 [Ampulex compressa]|nr:hypothetical protein KM043_001959 [Ampulex compressa]